MPELNLDKVWGGPGGRTKPGESERVGGMKNSSCVKNCSEKPVADRLRSSEDTTERTFMPG